MRGVSEGDPSSAKPYQIDEDVAEPDGGNRKALSLAIVKPLLYWVSHFPSI